MMDKKIEIEKIKAKAKTARKPSDKKAPAKKPAPKKKKTVAEEARELGLRYVGSGRYADQSGQVTHLNENGILTIYTG